MSEIDSLLVDFFHPKDVQLFIHYICQPPSIVVPRAVMT